MISSALYLFLGIAVLMIVVAVVLIGPRLFTSPELENGVDRDDVNLAIYRDEMNRLNASFSSGEITENEYELAKTELSRRFMSEIVTQPRSYGTAAPSSAMRLVGFLIILVIPVIAVISYLNLGNIQTLSMLNDIDSNHLSTSEQLRLHLETSPQDARSWALLARSEMVANNFTQAAEAFEKAISYDQRIANDPQILCEYAEALNITQGNTYRGRPTELIRQALQIAPRYPWALEIAGSAAYEEGNFRETLMYWTMLRDQLNPDSRDYENISVAISRLRAETGIYDDVMPSIEPPTVSVPPKPVLQNTPVKAQATPAITTKAPGLAVPAAALASAVEGPKESTTPPGKEPRR